MTEPARNSRKRDPDRRAGGHPPLSRATLAKALAAVLIGLGALGAGGARAVVVHLPARTLGYEPIPGVGFAQAGARAGHGKGHGPEPQAGGRKGVVDHGGPVMTSNTNYAVYWDPAGAPAYPAGYEAGIDRWFEDLAHDSGGFQNTDSVLVQYGAQYDSHFAGALPDTDPYPANGCSAAPTCLTDEQLRAELVKFVQAGKLPTGLSYEYFLITPQGVESCFEASGRECSAGASHAKYCSYHGYIDEASIVYANIPFTLGLDCDTGEEHPNGPGDAAIGGGIAHEHSESVTDPEGNAWFDSKGNEVADKCRTGAPEVEFGAPLGTAPDGSRYNEVIDGDLYWYQQEWSNETGECEQRAATRPTVMKLAPKKGPAAGGTAVTVTGSGFIGAVRVEFGEVEAGEVRVEGPQTLVAVSPPHAKGTAEVRVITEAGTSPATNRARFKYTAH